MKVLSRVPLDVADNEQDAKEQITEYKGQGENSKP